MAHGGCLHHDDGAVMPASATSARSAADSDDLGGVGRGRLTALDASLGRRCQSLEALRATTLLDRCDTPVATGDHAADRSG